MGDYIARLEAVFRGTRDRYQAHSRSVPILVEASQDSSFLRQVLQAHLSRPGVLNTLHYPVVGIPIVRNKDFELVANCWIPLPDGNTNLSTKAIHHHGKLLLTTVTCFGPGYEHWLFDRPRPQDGERSWSTKLLDSSPHVPYKPAFVDAYVAHVPFYPSSLSITYALWSHQESATWVDAVKQFKVIQNYKDLLIKAGRALKISDKLKINVVEYFDFYPSDGGLLAIQERNEFERGPNSDFLHSIFHILQETGNESLVTDIRTSLSKESIENRELVERLIQDTEKGNSISGRLSEGHIGVPFANFTREDIELHILQRSAARA